MADLPPRPLRRALTVPGTLALAITAVVLLPVTLVLAALHDLLHPRHRGRAIRSVLVVTVFLWIEIWAIAALGVLWLRSGFGRRIRSPGMQERHYRLILRYLDRCLELTRKLLHVQVTVEGAEPADLLNRPLLVFCRHAGVGDSLLIVHALMKYYGREPRIVLKDLLQWAPAFDIALNRLPSAWITAPASPAPAPAPGALRSTGDRVGPPDADTLANRAQEDITALATGLDHNDVLLIFPEGGNFTPRRRVRAIARLWREGRWRHARQALRMRNVLPPRPGGVLAALAAAPEADVVWVAHTGTDHLMSVRDVWRALPLRDPILMHWWQIPADQVPRGRDEQISWLYQWWERIDHWVAENRPPV